MKDSMSLPSRNSPSSGRGRGKRVAGHAIGGREDHSYTEHLLYRSSGASQYKPVREVKQTSLVPLYKCPHL